MLLPSLVDDGSFYMLEEKELRARIQEEFSNTKPYKGDYWNSARCIVINDDTVKARYVFFRHCEEYDKEYWIMKPLYETKYVIFENTKTGERLFAKADYEERQSAFFFSGLDESDIDAIVSLYKDLKSIGPVQALPHSDYMIFWNGNRKTMAIGLKKVETGWQVRWLH